MLADQKITNSTDIIICPETAISSPSEEHSLDYLGSIMKLRNFKDENFAKFHPGGSLGKKLLTRVSSVMKKDNLPICDESSSIKDIIHTITNGKCGLIVVLNENSIQGIITDGDIRRAMETNEDNFFSLKASDIMIKNPKTIQSDKKLIEASEIMTDTKINSLVVVNDLDELLGIVQMYDLGL